MSLKRLKQVALLTHGRVYLRTELSNSQEEYNPQQVIIVLSDGEDTGDLGQFIAQMAVGGKHGYSKSSRNMGSAEIWCRI